MVSGCPSCGASSDELGAAETAASRAPSGPSPPSFLLRLAKILLAPLSAIAHNTSPLVPGLAQNWSGSSLPGPQTSGGTSLPIDLTPLIPSGCRSVLMRNLSPTKTVQYAYVKGTSLPSQNFNTIPAASAISVDMDPTPTQSGKGLMVLLDNSASDAAFEVAFFT